MPMERRERSGALFPPPSPFLAAPASSLFPFPRLMLLEIQLGHRRPSEEEDRSDRVAFGKEYAAERVYYPQADLGATSGRLREQNGSAKGAPHSTTRTKECPTVEMQAMKARDISVKPILKRKEEHVD
ncbi:hypothetical protein BRADI_2g12482v3 [Brachypodium distachyon]|uniref:Uncharacterized protein n=1 Tax=Brachypodium distachyon TaxID=15368 RepID=A0A2K2D855_BRADI|nr:hypothetical protein BRADI_2g12482v3 [Brachypodium distachyon]